MVSQRRKLWLFGASMTTAVMAVIFGTFAYLTTLAEPYENTTIGYVVLNCDVKHLYEPESCGDILEELVGRIAEHVFLAVAASIVVSAIVIGGAWFFSRNKKDV